MEEHTCERVFDNKNVKSKWVANVMVEKFQCDSKVSMRDIIHEIRSKYSTGITKCRAFKAKQIAKELVEGDASK